MRKTMLLLTILILSALNTFSQTQRIAFRSHSGKAKEFTINEEGNLGLCNRNYAKCEKENNTEQLKVLEKSDSIAKAKLLAELKAKADSIAKAQKAEEEKQKLLQLALAPKPTLVKTDSPTIVKNSILEKANSAEADAVKIFPNPFSEQISIHLVLEKDKQTRVEIFDLNGRKVAQLCNKKLTKGDYHFNWIASDVSQGVYIVNVVIEEKTYNAKVVRQ